MVGTKSIYSYKEVSGWHFQVIIVRTLQVVFFISNKRQAFTFFIDFPTKLICLKRSYIFYALGQELFLLWIDTAY